MNKSLPADSDGGESPEHTGERGKGGQLRQHSRARQSNACFQFSEPQRSFPIGDNSNFTRQVPAVTGACIPFRVDVSMLEPSGQGHRVYMPVGQTSGAPIADTSYFRRRVPGLALGRSKNDVGCVVCTFYIDCRKQ